MTEDKNMFSALFKKRIQNEITKMTKNPILNIDFCPDEDDLHNWYFCICGEDPDTPYYGGYYIGNIKLLPSYPVDPLDFYFLTPNGRFQTNHKICLTITSYHRDTWSSVWNIQTATSALASIMNSDSDAGVAHIVCSMSERRKLAADSTKYNMANHMDILLKFKRFVKYDDKGNFLRMKTLDEIKAEMPVTSKPIPKIDLSAIETKKDSAEDISDILSEIKKSEKSVHPTHRK